MQKIEREGSFEDDYFLVFEYHWLRSDLQKGQEPLMSRSWLPQLGQKTLAAELTDGAADVSVGIEFSFVASWEIFCLRFFWDTPDWFTCFLLRTVARTAAITMITTKMVAAKNSG